MIIKLYEEIVKDDFVGDRVTSETVQVILSNNDKLDYTAVEGSPEDMVFGRDLEHASNIIPMLEAAYEAGKKEEELQIIYPDEQ